MATANRKVLPGFFPSLSFSLAYLTVLVILPLGACVWTACSLTWDEFLAAVWNERAIAAYGLTIGASFASALINVLIGVLLAWVLVRYEFPFKRLFDALIDLPFALPTAVAGLVYASLYKRDGWIGQFLDPYDIQITKTRAGIVLVLVFIGLPFIVRTVQPVLETLDIELEEAAASLGATRGQTFRRVILPTLLPSVLTGFALAFARALGEYGSVIFISSNRRFETEIAPMLIVERLEAFKYAEATAIAVVLLVFSFAMLIVINVLERWNQAYDA